jgi:hypothetical protein
VCPAASAALPFLTRLASDPRVTIRAELIGMAGWARGTRPGRVAARPRR